MPCKFCKSKEVIQGSSLGDTPQDNQSWAVSQQASEERTGYSKKQVCGKRPGGLGKKTVRKV